MYGHKYIKTPDPVYIDNDDDAAAWAEYYNDCDGVGYDTETTGLHKIKTRILFFSFADRDTRICAPVRFLHHFTPVLENPHIEKRMTNAKYDMHITHNHGIIIRGRTPDTIPADWLLDENRRGMHGLKETCRDWLGLRMRSFKEVFGGNLSTESEVRMLGRIHDVLESGDEDAALDILVELRRADGDELVIEDMGKISKSRNMGYTLKGRALVKMGRDHGIVGTTGGVKGFVSDWVQLLGGEPIKSREEREKYEYLLEDADWLAEAHEIIAGHLRPKLILDSAPLELLTLMTADYSSLDAWGSHALVDFYRDTLVGELMDEERTLLDHYEDNAVPYTRTLWNMERRGFAIDVDLAETYARPMEKEIGEIEREIVALVGFDLNPKSTPQLVKAFFTQDAATGLWKDPFGNKPKKVSDKTGVPSVDADALEEWAGRGNELAKLLLNHRELTKVKGTYVDPLPELVDRYNRIHTSLNQCGAVTGRLSSSDPNLQNIPSKGDWGTKIRRMFVPGCWGDCDPMVCDPMMEDVPVPDLPDDFPMTLIVADYDQLEMRIMAHFSQDEAMVDAILQGLDLHSQTASLAVGADYKEVAAAKKADPATYTPRQKELVDLRSNMKAIGFGLIYGIGALKLGMNLGLPILEKKTRFGTRLWCPEAEELIAKYFGIFPGVKRFIEDTHAYCEETQRVQTFVGRFRRLPTILSEEGGIAAQAERQSVNSIIQGTAADIAIEAMLKCERDEELRQLGCRMLLQVHDELVFEVPNHPDYIKAAEARVKELMENPFPMRVPITVSCHSAKSWGEAK